MAEPKDVRVKLRATLEQTEELTNIYEWLNKWKPALSHCTRHGGVWDERFEVVAPRSAIDELPPHVIHQVILERRRGMI